MTEVQGNILDYVGKVDVISHQVNDKGIMGGGLALQIKESYPNVFEAYKSYCENVPEDKLLGECAIVNFDSSSTLCANLFGQSLGGSGRQTNYEALYIALEFLQEFVSTVGLKSVAFPYGMGCGLGGGDWRIVRAMIESVFENTGIEVTIVKYN